MRSFIALAAIIGLVTASPIVQQRDACSSSSVISSLAPLATSTSTSLSSTAARDGTTPQTGAIIVDATGAKSDYKTVQAGVDALSTSSTNTQYLFIYPGTYNEQVYVPKLTSNLEIQGYTEDSTSYDGNKATITYNLALKDVTTNDLTATLRLWNPNTKVYNLNIENTFGHISTNGQNLAVSAQTDGQAFYGCQLWGYQDTLLSNKGNQLYAKTMIVGAIDFIYGKEATAWFEKVDLRTIADGPITASGRDSASNPSWYVFNSCTIAGINSTIAAGKNQLGRPWRNYARVVFQNTDMTDVVPAVGWRSWSASDPRTDQVTFAEFGNTGEGASGTRVDFATKLSAAMAPEDVLGSGYASEWWYDASYM